MTKELKLKRFINCYVPTETCNFRCEYCYITLKKAFNGKLFEMQYPIDEFKRAIRRERLGGMCLFNLCAGGETLLSPQVIPVVRAILEEGHHAAIVTNGTPTATIEKLLKLDPVLLEMLYFKFSFHYFELLRTNMMDAFFSNILKVQQAGCSFSVDITPHDSLVPYIPVIQDIFNEKIGAWPHISVARDTTTKELKILTKYSKEEYIKIWSVFHSEKFDYKIKEFMKPHREYCHAGDWTFSLEVGTGNLRKCDGAPVPAAMDFYNLYKKPDETIPFEAIGTCCPIAHCYNCHALLTLGTIEGLEAPTYAEMLDRVDNMGNHWLQPKIRELYSHRLGESYHAC